MAALVRLLMRYLEASGRIAAAPAVWVEPVAAAYGEFLSDVRGLSAGTVAKHVATATRFLAHLASRTPPVGLGQIGSPDVESFVEAASRGISRASLQHVVAQVRGFFRFLAIHGAARFGLDSLIDTPRVYRGERLPRSLPWPTVEALLHSIDRTSNMGRRDYAMLLLIATYGLRTSDVAALKLESVEWRAGRIRVEQRKTRIPLILPLTDEVGAALVDYLRNGRPALPLREVFLRVRAPAGILKPTAVTEAFQAWSRRSGLTIPWQGPHCIRHSFAVHLLRQGTALKIIGDLLGHRSAEATCVYLRLAIDDLRQVALPLSGLGAEGRP
jgi:site-specific recombinase XerD